MENISEEDGIHLTMMSHHTICMMNIAKRKYDQ
jgi:hypothetical protein